MKYKWALTVPAEIRMTLNVLDDIIQLFQVPQRPEDVSEDVSEDVLQDCCVVLGCCRRKRPWFGRIPFRISVNASMAHASIHLAHGLQYLRPYEAYDAALDAGKVY